MKRVSEILQERATLILIAFGLILIVLGDAIECRILKIEVGNLTAEVGGLLLVLGLIHWLYESSIRRQLFQEILESVVGAGRLSASGITDFHIHSIDVDYQKAIETSKELVIGEHHSTRIFENFAPAFELRNRSKLKTTVLLLKQGSAPELHLRATLPAYGDPQHKVARIREILRSGQIEDQPALATIKWHSQILKYSFVLTEECIWIRFYRNTTGFSLVPSLRVITGSQLYNFFLVDVKALTAEAIDD